MSDVKTPQSSSFLDTFFKISGRGSSVGAEVRGGFATFFTMAYIVVLNPIILGYVQDADGQFLGDGAAPNLGLIAVATALVAGLLTILMGVVANVPFALAAGLGLNAFVAYGIASQVSWEDAMGLVVLEGLIILVLVLTGFRTAVFHAIPASLKTAIANSFRRSARGVAGSYHTPEDVMAALAADPDEGVRACVARNETASCDILRSMVDDPSERVRGFLAINYFVPQDAMERGNSPRTAARWSAASHPGSASSPTRADVAGTARVDSWLWAVRVYKTQSAATSGCRADLVRVNGERAKAAQPVHPGDEVRVRIAGFDRVLVVQELIVKRVGAPEGGEGSPRHDPGAPGGRGVHPPPRRERGAGRPTKRERRELEKLRDQADRASHPVLRLAVGRTASSPVPADPHRPAGRCPVRGRRDGHRPRARARRADASSAAHLHVRRRRRDHRGVHGCSGTHDRGCPAPGGPAGPRVVRAEGDEPTGDPAVDEAYDGLGATFALFSEVYERNSIDGAGLALDGTVHYGELYDNAFWNGERMVFGDGDGEIFDRFTKSLTVIGHELSHGVVQYTAGLVYRDQSGALNESVADVFGALVEQYQADQTVDDATWLIGEGLFTDQVEGTALRSMKAPGTAYDDDVLGKDPQPAHMDDFIETDDDHGGVHLNSGIPNRAFVLVAEALGGRAWERAGRIWYDTLLSPITARIDFAGFAAATHRAATERYGEGSAEAGAVRAGWDGVGVGFDGQAS